MSFHFIHQFDFNFEIFLGIWIVILNCEPLTSKVSQIAATIPHSTDEYAFWELKLLSVLVSRRETRFIIEEVRQRSWSGTSLTETFE